MKLSASGETDEDPFIVRWIHLLFNDPRLQNVTMATVTSSGCTLDPPVSFRKTPLTSLTRFLAGFPFAFFQYLTQMPHSLENNFTQPQMPLDVQRKCVWELKYQNLVYRFHSICLFWNSRMPWKSLLLICSLESLIYLRKSDDKIRITGLILKSLRI